MRQKLRNLLNFPEKTDLYWTEPSKNRAFPNGLAFSMLNFQAGADTFPSSRFPRDYSKGLEFSLHATALMREVPVERL